MIVGWRLCRAPFSALDGEGARRFGGRWNSPGLAVVYFADHPALAVLEVIVHLDLPPEDLPDDYVLLRVALPGEPTRPVVTAEANASDVGDAWLRGGVTATLRVASVLVPQAENFLLNPLHAEASGVRVEATIPFRFDPRLLKAA